MNDEETPEDPREKHLAKHTVVFKDKGKKKRQTKTEEP